MAREAATGSAGKMPLVHVMRREEHPQCLAQRDGREQSEPRHPTRMASGCQDATPSSSSAAAPTGARWNAQTGVFPALGSRSAHRIADLRNTDGTLGSPDLHPSLPNASVQDVRGPTPPGAGTLDPKGAATARTGAVLTM